MKRGRTRRLFAIVSFFFFLSSCGVNTDSPVYPIFTSAFFNVVGAPAIVSLTPRLSSEESKDLSYAVDLSGQYIIQFDLDYYVTNLDEGFLGYNLYITSSTTSAEAAVTGIGVGPYLPLGVEPSFAHTRADTSTKASDIRTRRITHQIPPPGEKHFFLCEKYFFRLAAYTRSGVESQAGPEAAACAAKDRSLCPDTSICKL
ncbi:MAG: hypothetical protein HS115_03505 [Spirochaetales bacterium]|nr:hypothetical protein [Spirochaetales bacterium]